jgi:hypothetical protein
MGEEAMARIACDGLVQPHDVLGESLDHLEHRSGVAQQQAGDPVLGLAPPPARQQRVELGARGVVAQRADAADRPGGASASMR